MKILYARCDGDFDLIPAGGGQRDLAYNVAYLWAVEQDGEVRYERLPVPAAFRFNGTSRPGIVGWLVPRWGAGAVGSCFHDRCFTARPFLSTGERISRKEADLVFAELLPTKWRRLVARSVFWAVRLFGEPRWDAHDQEFRKDPARG